MPSIDAHVAQVTDTNILRSQPALARGVSLAAVAGQCTATRQGHGAGGGQGHGLRTGQQAADELTQHDTYRL